MSASMNLANELPVENRIEALDLLERARSLAREEGSLRTEAMAIGTRARILGMMGLAEQAQAAYLLNLELSRRARYRYGEGAALANLGMTVGRFGDLESGIRLVQEGLAILREIGARSAECVELTRSAGEASPSIPPGLPGPSLR